jgi:hypothetical protein
MDNGWNGLTEFMDAHLSESLACFEGDAMLRAALDMNLIQLAGTLLQAVQGDSSALGSQMMAAMGLAYLLGQRSTGMEVLDEWLGVAKGEG